MPYAPPQPGSPPFLDRLAPPHAVAAVGRRRPDAALLRWLFIASLLLYLFTAGSNFSSGDAYAELRVSQSLVDHGWVDVPREKPNQTCAGWGCQGIDGRFYATHGIGYSLYLLAFYLIAQATTRALHVANCSSWTTCVPIHLVSWSGSLLSALTVTLLCLLCLELGYTARRSLFLALLYGFATLAWPYARFGFDVTLTALLLVGACREALLATGAGPGCDRRWLHAGGLAALAILVRLPAAAAVAPLALYAVGTNVRRPPRHGWRSVATFVLPLIIALAFTCWYNWVRFGSASPLADGHAANRADDLTTFPVVSLIGLLVSPGKGLLWYAPVAVLALLCIPSFYRRHPAPCVLALTMAGCGLLPYLVVRDWIGGDAWGPRFAVSVLPLIILPAVELPAVVRSHPARLLTGALIGVGVILQLAGSLVNYAMRLRLDHAHGITTDQITWDPRYSPLGDHLQVLWTYLTHLQTASVTSDKGESFDVWWLTLWRNDQKSPTLTVLSGMLIGAMALLALWRLKRALAAAGTPAVAI